MRTTLVAGTALAGSLLMSTFIWESAQATSAPGLKGALVDSSTVTLVRDGGGGGGGGGRSVAAAAAVVAAIQVVAAATAVATAVATSVVAAVATAAVVATALATSGATAVATAPATSIATAVVVITRAVGFLAETWTAAGIPSATTITASSTAIATISTCRAIATATTPSGIASFATARGFGCTDPITTLAAIACGCCSAPKSRVAHIGGVVTTIVLATSSHKSLTQPRSSGAFFWCRVETAQ